MILSFKHKDLQLFFEKGQSARLKQDHLKRLRLILAKLHAAESIKDMNFPGSNLHPLKGKEQTFWSVSVNVNWRLIFRLEAGNAYDVDYLDYH